MYGGSACTSPYCLSGCSRFILFQKTTGMEGALMDLQYCNDVAVGSLIGFHRIEWIFDDPSVFPCFIVLARFESVCSKVGPLKEEGQLEQTFKNPKTKALNRIIVLIFKKSKYFVLIRI